MAISKTQYPANLHSVFIPTHYTYQSTITGSANFRFKYTLTDIDGQFFQGLTVPLENSLSYNEPTEILKSKTKFNFNPSIQVISNIPDNCIVYREVASEDVSGGHSTGWYTKTAFRYSDTEFNPYDNFINDSAETDFLVNMPKTHEIRMTDDFTFRTYNGYPNVSSSNDFGGVYVYKMDLFDNGKHSGAIKECRVESIKNPYYGAHSSGDYSVTETGDNFNIELPAGAKNWYNKLFNLRSFVTSDGTYVDTNQTNIFLFGDGISNHIWFNFGGTWYNMWLDNYDYWAYRWPHGTFGQVSVKHNFKIIEDCKFDSVNVAWENTKGGVDYYLFTKANEKKVETKKAIYNKNQNILNLSTKEVEKDSYNKGTSVYRNNVNTFYELNTNWLSQDEINGLEDIFKSTEVYMNIDNKWVYVISVERKAIIYNKKRFGLKKYKLNFQIGELKSRS